MNNMKRYAVNITNDIRFVDSNTIVIKTLKGRFKLKGDNISIAFRDIINCFKEPTNFNEVISTLIKKYSVDSLQKMLDFLVDKNILIDKCSSEILQKYDKDFVDKTLYYTLGGKPLREIIDELAPMHVGIIGTNQLVNCLLNDLTSGGLLFNFNIVITDRTLNLSKITENSTVNITNYTNLSDPLYMNSFIDKSDFIIASSNYSDHYLFEQVNELCIEKNKKWLRIMIDGDYSEIGPLFIPNKTCCYFCLRTRETSNMSEDKYIFDNLYEDSKLHEDLREKSVGLYSTHYISSLSSAIACSEMMKLLADLKCNLLNQVIRVNCIDFEVQKDTIFRYHMCPVCSERL